MAPSGPGGRRAAIREHLDELYDFALTVTWDPAAAAAAVAAAIARLGEREPDRSVLLGLTRSESLARGRGPEPVRVDPAAEPAPLDPSPDELELLALGVLSGLSSEERATLDLGVRRHLEPHDLAAALDVPADVVNERVAEARARADHLLGHYVLARVGTRHCTALASAVDTAPAGLEPLAHRVELHLAECEACSARRAGFAPATTFLPSIPDRPAPSALADSLFRRHGLFRRFTHGSEHREPRRWRRVVGVVALVALVAAILGVGALVVRDESSEDPAVEPTPVAALAGTPRTVDFGPRDTSATATLRNTSDATVDWTAGLDVPWLAVEPAEGRVGPGESVTLTLTLDRADAPEGEIVTTARFEAADEAAEVEVTAQVSRPPRITGIEVDPTSVSAAPCDGGVTSATVTATVVDGSLDSVVVDWTAPDETTGETAMEGGSEGWSADLGPFETAGMVTWSVTATDTNGESAQTAPANLAVTAECTVTEETDS